MKRSFTGTLALKNLGLITALALGLASSAAFADQPGKNSQSVVAEGGVFYKMPDGTLINRDATLEVPARGQGDVILRSGPLSLTAHGFKTIHKHGRAIFYVVFLDPPGAPENTAVVYRGSYLRGSNGAKYWGDVFSRTYKASGELSDLLKVPGVDNLIYDFEHSDHDGSEWRHSGGFWFKAVSNK
jgi:hypothetical protein